MLPRATPAGRLPAAGRLPPPAASRPGRLPAQGDATFTLGAESEVIFTLGGRRRASAGGLRWAAPYVLSPNANVVFTSPRVLFETKFVESAEPWLQPDAKMPQPELS